MISNCNVAYVPYLENDLNQIVRQGIKKRRGRWILLGKTSQIARLFTELSTGNNKKYPIDRSIVLDRAPLIMCNYLSLSLLPQFNLLSCLALLQCINVLVTTSLLQIHFQPRDKNEPPVRWIMNI